MVLVTLLATKTMSLIVLGRFGASRSDFLWKSVAKRRSKAATLTRKISQANYFEAFAKAQPAAKAVQIKISY